MTDTDWRIQVYGVPLTGAGKRQAPKRAVKDAIIAKQGGRCLYCQFKIGAVVKRRGAKVTLRVHWDHFIPYSYSLRNPGDGWVMSCHVCNLIKSCTLFSTIEQAKVYIADRRTALGYEMSEWEDRDVRA